MTTIPSERTSTAIGTTEQEVIVTYKSTVQAAPPTVTGPPVVITRTRATTQIEETVEATAPVVPTTTRAATSAPAFTGAAANNKAGFVALAGALAGFVALV